MRTEARRSSSVAVNRSAIDSRSRFISRTGTASPSGAGALGTVAFLSLTSMPPIRVVGTDLAFGLDAALVGSGIHNLGGSYSAVLLCKMIMGAIFGAIAGSIIALLAFQANGPALPFPRGC